MALKEEEKAPEFTLKDKEGKEHKLIDIKTKYLILYFYPKDDTPGCTIEAKEFSKDLEEFNKIGATIIGISGGNEETKKKFCEKHNLKIILLSDPEFKISDKYKVYGEKEFMGNKTMGIKRTTFIIDKNHKIIKTFENVKPEGHSKEILNFLQGGWKWRIHYQN